MEEDTEAYTIQVSHTNEAKAKVKVDAKDMAGLPSKFDTRLNPKELSDREEHCQHHQWNSSSTIGKCWECSSHGRRHIRIF